MTTPSYRGTGGAAALEGLKTEEVGFKHFRVFGVRRYMYIYKKVRQQVLKMPHSNRQELM